MKTFVLSVVLPEGNDEFWEEVISKKKKKMIEEVEYEVKSCLQDHGHFDAEVKLITVVEANDIN